MKYTGTKTRFIEGFLVPYLKHSSFERTLMLIKNLKANVLTVLVLKYSKVKIKSINK
jgi:hypothetical protein